MLEVQGLVAGYGAIRALHGVDLRVAEGELVALLGANGAGKTTLLRCLAGVLPPQAGRVAFRDQDVTRWPAARRVRLGLSLVPEGRQVLANMSVEENLQLGATLRPEREAGRDMEAMYARFPVLAQRRHVSAGLLSGGEQQQLAVARALMARPRLLLLDEPSLGLAPKLVRAVFELVVELRAEGLTVLIVEQNARQALAVADRAYVLETGRIALEGPAAELAGNPAVQAAYLGADV